MTKIHRLADYAPPRFHVEAIGLDVELDPDRTLVEATIDFVRTASGLRLKKSGWMGKRYRRNATAMSTTPSQFGLYRTSSA